MILFYVALAFLAGVIAGALGLTDAWPLLALGGAGASIGWLLASRRREALLAAILLLVALAGIERYDAALPSSDLGGVALLNDAEAPVTLRGVIAGRPEERETSRRFTVAVDAYLDTNGDWQPAPGSVLVTSRLYPAYAYGDKIELTGRLETPPVLDGFDYREYLARRGVVSTVLYPQIEVIGAGGSDLTRRLQDVRDSLSESLQQALPEPESALARGILLGERASIPDDLTDDFNRAGISHLIAISGQNVILVAGFVVASLASLIGRRPATAIAMAFVLVYAVFVGASPSVLRAAVMATVMLGAVLAGRPASALPGVVLAAAVLVAAKPLLIDDVSFQLSFAATLGIVLASQRLRALFLPRLTLLPGWLATFLAENAAITTAASLAVLPVIAGTFGRISLISLPANLLAAPVFVLALFGSAATALAGILHPGLGSIAGEVSYLPLNILVRIGRLAADIPGAALEVTDLGAIEIGAMCIAVAALMLLIRRLPTVIDTDTAPRGRVKPALAAAALVLIAAVFVWWGDLRPESGRLSFTVLDVGQGDALLIETPQGARILIDGGPSGARLAQALGRRLPTSERRIDLIVLTHAQDDHVTGFVELLERYEVGGALSGPLQGETAAYDAWREELARRDVPLLLAAAGQSIDLGDGVRIDVLGPPPDALSDTQDDHNNNSVVLRLVYGSVSFLLTGDLAAEGEDALLASGADLRSTVLKVAHHGSDGSTMPAFLEAVAPEFAVISAGVDNDFGHPSPTTRLRLAGIPLLRTDLNGDVSFETDGSALWVTFDRGDYSRVELGAAR